MRTIWKQVVIAFLALACGTLAHACIPANYQTKYFGEVQHVSDDLYVKVMADIYKNHYQLVEARVGLWRFPLVRKGDVVFLDDKPIATKKDSFWYLGRGYYQLNHELYYLGEHVGAFPANGTVIVYEEDRSPQRPDNLPPNFMWCPALKHANILETSGGLHVEHEVYDN